MVKTEKTLIEANKSISNEIDQVVESTDIYMADEKYVDEPNKSRIVLYNNVTFEEGGKVKYAPHVGVKLHMPNLQEKLQLRFTTYDEDDMERGINRNRYHAAAQERRFGSSLAFFQELRNVKTEFRPRVELRDGIQTSHIFRFWSDAKAGPFIVEPELQLFGRSDVGTGQFFALDFKYEVNAANILTIVNEEEYTDGTNTMTTNQGLIWDYVYSSKAAWENSLIFESNNRPRYHLDRYVYRTSFAYKLRKNVLHYKITPYATCAKEESFHPRATLDVSVEVIF